MSGNDNDNLEIPTVTDVGSNTGYDEDDNNDEPDPVVDDPSANINQEDTINGEVRQKESSRNIFQARVFAEQNSNVYGAEIVLFGSETEEPIERILITDVTDYDRLNILVDNLQKALVPYTKSDLDNLQIISDYLTDRENADKLDAYNNLTWSSLQQKGDLETILDNNSGLDSATRQEYLDRNDKVVINATHLNELTDADFSPLNHSHDNYLTDSHLTLVGDTTKRGHVSIVDNLNTTSVGGTALSAKQGNVLNNNINNLKKDVYRGWETVKTDSQYISLRVNPLLKLAVCDYTRWEYTGLKSGTGKHELHKKNTIPSKYAPSQRVVTPVYNNTVTLMFQKDGSLLLYNTVKHDSWNIRVQCMWYYG